MAKDMRSSPLDQLDRVAAAAGTELIGASLKNGDDVALTSQQVADLGDGGSGLPSQWTDGGNGDVTATVDDAAKTPITVFGIAGQTAPLIDAHNATQSVDGVVVYADDTKTQLKMQAVVGQLQADQVVLIEDELGGTMFTVDQEPGATGTTLKLGLGAALDGEDAKAEFLVDNAGGFQDATLMLGITAGGAVLGREIKLTTFVDFNDHTNDQVTLDMRMLPSQVKPALIVRDSDSVVRLQVSPTGWLDVLEQSDPAAPSANTGRVYVRDTGGKSQLVCRFPSGAVQVLATEP